MCEAVERLYSSGGVKSWRLKLFPEPSNLRQVLDCSDGVRQVTALGLATLFESVGW